MWRKCRSGWTHTWSKWRPKYPSLRDQSDFYIRECEDCGFRQQTWVR